MIERSSLRFFTSENKIENAGISFTPLTVDEKNELRNVFVSNKKENTSKNSAENWKEGTVKNGKNVKLPEKLVVPVRIGSVYMDTIPSVNEDLRGCLLDRGVHSLVDPISSKYNFSETYSNILQPEDTKFENIPPFVTASRDKELAIVARDYGCKYFSSSSSSTGKFFLEFMIHNRIVISFLYVIFGFPSY